MPIYLTVTEVVRNFSEILGRVRFRGERFVLTKGGKPVAELGPVTIGEPVRLEELPALLAALPHLGTEEAERFAQDLEQVRQASGTVPATGPWGS
jgi:antitoxin (DNA-binding transcriptional repressor) of toxin-antitoxin stability system